VVADSAELRGKCIKRHVRSAKRNVKFLSSLEKTVRSIVKIVFQSVKTADVKKEKILNRIFSFKDTMETLCNKKVAEGFYLS